MIPAEVLRVGRCDAAALAALLQRYGLRIVAVPAGAPIPGSHWGEPEAGLIQNRLYLRPDTPLHSALHEACHYVCMDGARRAALHTDAGGGYDEENAVCYLQILLADELPGVGRARLCRDMDAWGYTFRLGSAAAYFADDAAEARAWLLHRGLIGEQGRPTWRLRDDRANRHSRQRGPRSASPFE
ncbi:MAG TPA: hypothetical protein ENJ19_00315 [Gammaproteobacteria bacterium]|nr:hypothetical protein [Gammaproteobacteria bacterium]